MTKEAMPVEHIQARIDLLFLEWLMFIVVWYNIKAISNRLSLTFNVTG